VSSKLTTMCQMVRVSNDERPRLPFLDFSQTLISILPLSVVELGIISLMASSLRTRH